MLPSISIDEGVEDTDYDHDEEADFVNTLSGKFGNGGTGGGVVRRQN